MFVCECDRQAAMCFAKAEYNPDHEHLPSDRCQWPWDISWDTTHYSQDFNPQRRNQMCLLESIINKFDLVL